MKRYILGFFATIGFVIFISIVSIILFIQLRSYKPSISENTVLQLNFDNPVVEISGDDFPGIFFTKTTKLDEVILAINQATKDPKIVGIVAKFNNVDMGLAQAKEIRNAILKFRAARKGATTIAYSDAYAETGRGTTAYYLASAFEEVWMQPVGELGFMGIAVEVPFVKEALEKLKLKAQIGKRKEYKSMPDTFTETGLTEANRVATQDLINNLMEQIIQEVAKSRELSVEEIKEAMNRSPLSGKESLSFGLIDKISYFDSVEPYINKKTGKTIKMVNINKYKSEIATNKRGAPKIAIIYGVGDIHQDKEDSTESFATRMGSHITAKAFDQAIKDEDVKAIVFRINSGGGSPSASETIRHSVELAKAAGKKVIVSMSDAAASGGYWIAVNADKIVANSMTITGSIGVYAGKLVTGEFWKNLGINWEQLHVGDNAIMSLPTQEYSEYGWQRLQSSLDHIYETFINNVAKYRKLPKEHVEEVAKGRVWTGSQALKYGLVDKLGDLTDAIAIARAEAGIEKEPLYIEVLPKRLSFIEKVIALALDKDESIKTRIPFLGMLIALEEMYVSTMAMLQTTAMPMGKPKG